MGQFRYNNIDGNLCTHVMYSFMGISTGGDIRILDKWLDISLHNFQKTVKLKRKFPHLKIMASVGGWNERSATFSAVAKNARLRENFANNALNFVRKYNFDGIDIDWEFPGQRGGDRGADKGNFVLFLQTLYAKFHPARKKVTIATNTAQSMVAISFDLRRIHPFVDYILMMTYDYRKYQISELFLQI